MEDGMSSSSWGKGSPTGQQMSSLIRQSIAKIEFYNRETVEEAAAVK